ncbi:MAG: sensor domain-containing diguanylate cyclase [Deltaproteobacteria bacterium]|nr:sensor domain-containing diguanylate cyclase [Deltaproteobacteria bacterium]
MDYRPRSLGFQLIAVTIGIVAAAVVVVAVVVGKLSEDDVRERLLRQASEVASAVDVAAGSGARPGDLGSVVLGAKARSVGGSWVLDRDGRFVAAPDDPRYRRFVEQRLPFGDADIELIAVQQPLAARVARAMGSQMPLKAVIDQFQSGVGILRGSSEPMVVAFHVLRDRGWLVGVDEPYATQGSAVASLKRYVLLTCAILGLSILLSTALSISFIIKPYYREKLELSERMEAANRNLKKLHDVSVGMQKSRSLEGRIQKTLGAAHEVLGLDRIFIFLPNPEHTVLECRGAFGNQDEPPEEIAVPMGPEGGVLAQAFLKRKTFRVLNAPEMPRELRLPEPYSEIKALRSRSFVVLPMIVENSCVGVVAVDNHLSKRPITDEIIEGLELFTSQAAVAIENGKLYQQLKLYADELEVTDHLTQLFTFFHFKKLLQGEVDRVRVSGQPLSLAVVSVDNFAQYNELLGHKFGDEVLRRVASVIRESARKKDVIGRCFGSTFAVMLPNTSEEAARQVVTEVLGRLSSEAYPGIETLSDGKIHFLDGVGEYRKGEAWTAEDFFSDVHGRSKRTEA